MIVFENEREEWRHWMVRGLSILFYSWCVPGDVWNNNTESSAFTNDL